MSLSRFGKKKLIVLSAPFYFPLDINFTLLVYCLQTFPSNLNSSLFLFLLLLRTFSLQVQGRTRTKWRKVYEPAFPSATEPTCAARCLAQWSMPEPRDLQPSCRSLRRSRGLRPPRNRRWTWVKTRLVCTTLSFLVDTVSRRISS